MNIKNLIFLFCFGLILNTGCKEKSNAPTKDPKLTEEELANYARKTFSQRTEIFSPERELAGFTVPEGFVVELVASEEDGVINPIDLTFDDAGRLWTQTAEMYPLDPVTDIKWDELLKLMNDPEAQEKHPNFKRILDLYRGTTRGEDKILVLSNLYEGSNVKTKVWADGLAIPQSILPFKNGSYVAQGSELFFLDDTDNDGKADKRTPLFTGFGFTDTHTMAHVLVRGPGDWIHFSQGALNKGEVSSIVSNAKIRLDYSKIARFSLDAKKIELVNAGLNNIWGFQLRNNGQWYATEANDLGYSIVPMEVGSSFPGIGGERLRSYQPFVPELHEFRVGGTGISGLAFADDSHGSYPEEWKDVAFLANPITSTINAVRIVRNSDGTVSAQHLPDLLTSKDDWFRPVNIEFGPDGCLYIADWYNKIISHNEVTTTHPDRDKSHGRIWRIRHKSQKKEEIPNFYNISTDDLPNYLKSPSLWAKRAAWHQISDRPFEETKILARDIVALAEDASQDKITRIVALWALEGIHHYDKELITRLLKDPTDDLRREAIRSLASFSLSANEIAIALKSLSEDANPMIRSQVLRTLQETGIANPGTIEILVGACKPEISGNTMGGAYERKFERYLARKALEKYPEELARFIESPQAIKYASENLIWAGQALPEKKDREQVFLDHYQKVNYKDFDESTFIMVANMLGNPDVYRAIKPILENNLNAETHVSLAIKFLSQIQSEGIKNILEKPVRALLKSKEVSKQQLGLEAVAKLHTKNVGDIVVEIGKSTKEEKTLTLVVHALDNEAKKNSKILLEFTKNENLSLEIRTKALNSLAKGNKTEANTILEDWLPNLDRTQRRELTRILSSSEDGAGLLLLPYKKGLLDHTAFDISTAERVHNANTNNAGGIALLEAVKKSVEEEKKAFKSKLQRFMAIAEKGSGDPEKGEKLFQTCILCHRVGDQGQEIAPALDGSATRENEALLTAILDPDAALESSYAIYRVVKENGATVEGYLAKRDNRGITLAFMGGSTTFIPTDEVRTEGFLGGRSFMPKGLIENYADEQVADLLAYIKTLN